MREPVTGRALIERIDRQAIPTGAVGVWWLGQSSLVLKAGGTTIYVDPYLQQSARRLTPSACAPEEVTNAELVILTHDHLDHIDPTALPGIALASPGARFVAPRPTVDRVAELVGDDARVVAATAGEALALDGVELIPVAAKHEEFDRDPALGYPYLGYIIRVGGVTIYNAGDTIPYEGLVEAVQPHAVDLAFLPINGRDFYRTRAGTIGNFDYREAAETAVAIGADVAVPVHYGMFAGNTVPVGHFVSYLADFHPHQQSHVLGRYGFYLYARP